MTTNTSQSNNSDLERKLDDIKSALHMRTTATSVLDDIEHKLNEVEASLKNLNEARQRDKMQTAWLAVAIMGAAWVGAGVVAGVRSWAGGTLTVLGLILGIVAWCVITKGSKRATKEGEAMTTKEPQSTNDDIKSELVKIKQELVDTKELVKKAGRKSVAQFYLTFAVMAMLGAYELKSLIIYILALVLLVGAVLKYYFGFKWIPD